MATGNEGDAILNAQGDGYAVVRVNEFHKRVHLWRIEHHNHWHSIATFNSEDEAERFLSWMLQISGLRTPTPGGTA